MSKEWVRVTNEDGNSIFVRQDNIHILGPNDDHGGSLLSLKSDKKGEKPIPIGVTAEEVLDALGEEWADAETFDDADMEDEEDNDD